MNKPVEEDIITFTQVEIKHFMPEWTPNEKNTQDKNIPY